ncbi:MAG TPA: glycosyltransferase family 4 protein [Candidatus Paceibacterota bacterium]|nr:glycosyltransferase family 4 protein [Candidatus Paceibacterota bacterium]
MKILAFPRDTGNPYQELLYRHMRERGDNIVYIPSFSSSATLNLFSLPVFFVLKRTQGYKILHIHWVYPFSLKAKIWQNRIAKKILYQYYLFCLFLIKFLGYKLVWTAHNIMPHESVFLNDFQARVNLIKKSDLVIFPSVLTQNEIIKIMKPHKSIVVPIGSYIGVYPMGAERLESRQRLRIPLGDFVYLYIGSIRPYKGLEDLLGAYRKIKSSHNHLIVGGLCLDRHLRSVLDKASESNEIIWHDGIIPDDELQFYFAAANITVLPFKKVTTSSSILLSFSFGRSAIVPNLGDLSLLPDNLVYKYNPVSPNGLIDAMVKSAENLEKLEQKSQNAKAYAEKLNWPSIVENTRNAIKSLFAS